MALGSSRLDLFCMVIISISIQGTLLLWAEKKISMIDQTTDISHTFNDYQEDSDISFIKSNLDKTHSWCGQTLEQLRLPAELLVSMIVRRDEIIVPTGQTVLDVGDFLVLAARSIDAGEHLILREVVVKNQK